MKVLDFMTKDVTTCTESQTVGDAAKKMIELGISVMPVVNDEGILTGIVTQSDFISKEVEIPHALVSIKRLFGQDFNLTDVEDVYKKSKNKTLADVMSHNVVTVTSENTLNGVVELMMSKHLKRIPVVDDGKLVGMITRKDILKAFEKLS
ncbi:MULTISPECIES: CBS domain-containing protein [Halobacteriovorax]|uniref:CBS domain-containing protein n=1 Tax=Halobacteriovorax vibrionivorans TaxID=2152716 RepID=A0ABY0IF03_9BACT|nr:MULTISPECIES: CBS domain-containing protein [Halobacteriovorax]AYF43949.1 CBS domain protein [Halobacteriovorax sp. BALOs_7]RZF21521.1 CBS domain-containing protein [Halobacteriovorax vibrionivorans]TGD49186.1 CBS domain-containing protein [Halobacteriovorax sp. Y22]